MPFANRNKRTQTPTDYSIILENQTMNHQTRSLWQKFLCHSIAASGV
ncbi:MAG: hypothetical protein RIB93_23115 [Coleofasciculus sp. D1-CHI-01]